MNDLRPACQTVSFAFPRFQFIFPLLVCIHIAVCCFSLSYLSTDYSTIFVVGRSHLSTAIVNVSAFAMVALIFVWARFSFGYFLGFYFYTMILGYLWIIPFSRLSYDHSVATVSIFISALAFLVPSLLLKSDIQQRFKLSAAAFDKLLSSILALGGLVVAIAASYHFRLVGVLEIYKFREVIELPALLKYAVGIISNALLPFAFAWYSTRRDPWRAALALTLIVLLYPIMLTKLTLFAPFWLLFLLLLSRLLESRLCVLLSLLLPMGLGVVLLLVSRIVPFDLGEYYFGIVNSRMIATPAIALEIYNHFFSTNELTHFCQIRILQILTTCPYHEELGAVMAKAYGLGSFNASLFATEGIASVGSMLAPVPALAAGFIIAFSNRLSSGLPPRFVLLSGGVLPQVFLNVPLSTCLLSNGAVLLFLLWYITPRDLLEH